jgi:serine/threonine protein phosphatase PrpC
VTRGNGSALWLLGRDFPDLGTSGFVVHAQGGALALSRGRLPKPYAHVDPNEDAALLAHAERGTLLAVTDGFNGVAASELALAEVERSVDRLLDEDPEAFEEEIRSLARRIGSRDHRLGESHTCLALIAIAGEICHVAGFGDSCAFRATAPEPLIPPDDPPAWTVLGEAADLPPSSRFAAHFRAVPGERLAVVSDGVTNFTRSSVPETLAGARDDGEAAVRILEDALAGGAGDNVSVVTFSIPPLPSAGPASKLGP